MGKKKTASEEIVEINTEISPAQDGVSINEEVTSEKVAAVVYSEVVDYGEFDPVMDKSKPGWNSYVLTHFAPNELEEGSPKVGGLRRVTEKLIGRIVGIRTNICEAPSKDNDFRAVATTTIRVLEHGVIAEYDGSADACYKNVNPEFAAYPTAMAETRSRARALRNALSLDVVSSDEKSAIAIPSGEEFTDERANDFINDGQIKVINTLCARNNVNVKNFANMGKNVYKNISEIKYNTAKDMIKKLTEYQQDQTKIPADIGGYDSNWRTYYGS